MMKIKSEKSNLRRGLVGVLVVSIAAASCLDLDSGGANQNRRSPGDQPGGVQVGLGEIGVSAQGEYVVFQGTSTLSAGYIETGEVRRLPVVNPTRMAFSRRGDILFVASKTPSQLVALDIRKREVLWSFELSFHDIEDLRLETNLNDSRLLVAERNSLHVLDALTGEPIQTQVFEEPIFDVRVLDDNRRAVVVESHTWEDGLPSTSIDIVDLKTASYVQFQIPNCASLMAFTSKDRHGLLAPTDCLDPQGAARDPISVVDLSLGEEKFVRNLPGFGPVAVSANGDRAVAFVDSSNVDASLFDDPSQIPSTEVRFYLMVIESETLKFELYPVGSTQPRYTLTPDGTRVLIDNFEMGRGLTLFDLETGRFEDINAPGSVELDNFVLTDDSRFVYGITKLRISGDEIAFGLREIVEQNHLFSIDLETRKVLIWDTSFVPENINISSDNEFLFLRMDSANVCVYSIQDRDCVRVMSSSE
jgi:hypothetical protein